MAFAALAVLACAGPTSARAAAPAASPPPAKAAAAAAPANAPAGTAAPAQNAAPAQAPAPPAQPSTPALPPGRIIISGASGHLGRLVTEDLLARGVPADRLILVSRTPQKLSRYARLGASTRFGDFTRPKSLPAAFAGGERMLLISIGDASIPRAQAHKNAIDAAVADGIKQIVYTSFIALTGGARTGLAAAHYKTEQFLRHSGVAWTMLRNSIYTQILLPQARKMVADGHVDVPVHPTRIAYVTREDCAAAAAAVLATPGHQNEVYNITGPRLIGPRDTAAIASVVTGKHIAIATVDGRSPSAARYGGAAISVVSNDFERLTGHKPTSVRRFFERHRQELLMALRPGSLGDRAARDPVR